MDTSRLLDAARICVGFVIFIPNFATAAIISLHSGDTDPTTEGWTVSAPGGGGGMVIGAVNDSGTLAWKIDDNSFASNSSYQYIDSVSTQEESDASTLGWTLSVDLRLPGPNPDALDLAVYVGYDAADTRYYMNFGTESDGDPIVNLFGGTSYTLQGVGNTDYHSYELVYDPILGSADLFVDGVEQLSDYTGFAGVVGPRVSWGAGDGSKVGHGNYSFVQFEIAAVPVPAAAWLFGSGLIGLIGIARRKKAA